MTTLIGIVIVFGSIIGGAGPGSLVVIVPPKLFKKVLRAVPTIFKAPNQSKEGSLEVLGLLYEVFTKIERDGALAIEKDVEEPREEGREFVRVESCGVSFGSFRIRESIRRGNNQDRAPGAVVHGHYADRCP